MEGLIRYPLATTAILIEDAPARISFIKNGLRALVIVRACDRLPLDTSRYCSASSLACIKGYTIGELPADELVEP